MDLRDKLKKAGFKGSRDRGFTSLPGSGIVFNQESILIFFCGFPLNRLRE